MTSPPSFAMPRKNDVPTEWVLIVRGHRPQSEQWPLVPGHTVPAKQRQCDQVKDALSNATNRLLTKVWRRRWRLGSEESTAKTEIQGALPKEAT